MAYHLGSTDGSSNSGPYLQFKVSKRATPTMNFWTSSGGSGVWNISNAGGATTSVPSIGLLNENGGLAYCGGFGSAWTGASVNGHWAASAEL